MKASIPTLRMAVLFFVGYAVNAILHEFAHALTAHFLHVGSTLFHFYVNVKEANAADVRLAAISAAGPCFSLLFGITSRVVYRKRCGLRSELMFFTWRLPESVAVVLILILRIMAGGIRFAP